MTTASLSADGPRRHDRNFGLDVLRASAILSVLLYHSLQFAESAPNWLAWVFSRGWMGVDLFFVLSGFLIGTQALRIPDGRFWPECLAFWCKRWTRTLPLYFVVLLFYVLLKPAVLGIPFYGFNWKYFFFLQNFGRIEDFGQTWSICIEEQFYLAFPFVVLMFGKRRPVVWLLPLFLSVVVRAVTYKNYVPSGAQHYLELFRFQTIAMLDAISVGVFLASTQERWRGWSVPAKAAAGLIGLVVLLITAYSIPEFPEARFQVISLYLLIAVSFGAILIFAESVRAPVKGFGFVYWISLWSYGAYLWHMVFTRFVARSLPDQHWFFQIVIYLLLTGLVSWFTYVWIEKPGMGLRKKILPLIADNR